MSKLRPHSRPSLVMAAAGVAMAGALGIAGTASAADWPMFRANPGHSGVSPETAISTTTAHSLSTRWTARLGTPSYTSPAVATTRGRALVYAGAGNHFYAYPARGGAAAWRFTVPAGVVENSPAVAGGVVYFASTAGTIFALNASTGARMCSFSTGHAILASPVVVNSGSGPVVYDGTLPTGASGAEYAIYGPGNSARRLQEGLGVHLVGAQPGRYLVLPGVRDGREPRSAAGVRQQGPRRLRVRGQRQHRRAGLALSDQHRGRFGRGRPPDHLRARAERLRQRRRLRDRQRQDRLCP